MSLTFISLKTDGNENHLHVHVQTKSRPQTKQGRWGGGKTIWEWKGETRGRSVDGKAEEGNNDVA